MLTHLVDFADIVRDQAAVQPDGVAMVFQGRKTTYRQLDRAASQVANGLRAIDPTPGTRVATLDKNTDHFYELLLGAAKAGQALVPVNYRLAPPEVATIVNDARAQVLFVGPEYVPIVEQIRPLLPTVRKVITLSVQHQDWEDYEAWRDDQSADDPMLRSDPDDVVLQLYTSGTTGRPKGVQLTHANTLALLAAAKEWWPAQPSDVSMVCMPQYHIAGALLGWLGFGTGSRSVVVREVNPTEILRLIPSEQVTMAIFVPAVLLFLLQAPGCRETDFSSLRHIVYGASPIPLDLLRDALATFRCDFGQVYGMTETTGTITYLPPEDHDPAGTPRMRSCGRPLPVAEVKVVDDSGHELPIGQVGEIVCRSRLNMKGYWNLPDETAKAIRDGWLYTGDAGYFDAEGYLYIYDRIKDMIVSGAENIYPAEVESALFGHPAVADVGVIGVPDERWGEAVKAIVVREPGTNVSAEELIAFVRTRIGGYKVPKSIDFVEALPRNASGKILKRELRAPYWQGRERQVN
jgi:acyl-CoA synthetase (AMP-forming)/AMP-acid ligase II